jgi:phosphoglycerol transferase MdoB-like AlkP superfamily enzyme
MIRTSRKPVYKKQNYFSTEELKTIYSPVHYPDPALKFKKMNVIVIIVESLGKETLGCYNRELDNGTYLGYTPFLDSLAKNSVVFINSFANSKWSIDGTPALIAGIPSLQEAFTQSFCANNAINSLPSCLSEKGYTTAFAHGAPNGSLGLTGFAVMAGIHKYIGKNEYANNADFDGVWGVWDHKFLPFFSRECSRIKEPFFASVFTTSSHHPYKIPTSLSTLFAEGPLPIYRSIRYVDYALKLFFKEASNQSWFQNTIFVISGDHACIRYHDVYKTSLGAYGVPLIFYTPGGQLAARRDYGTAQQIDVMPTILNFLGYNKPYFAFGKDLFDEKEDKIAINYVGDSFQMIWDNWVIQYNTHETIALYDLKNDLLMINNLVGENDSVQSRMERKVKAIVQQHNNRMADNWLLPD